MVAAQLAHWTIVVLSPMSRESVSSPSELAFGVPDRYSWPMPVSPASRPDAERPDRPRSGQAIDFSRYIPTVLSRLVSKLQTSASAFFKQTYDVNLFEWRILATLAAEGPKTAYAIWTEGGLDKAAVSRALKALEARGLVAIEMDASRGGRKRTRITLTESGRRLHENTFGEVVARHGRLVSGIPAEDLEVLLRVLNQLSERVPLMADERTASDEAFRITTE